MQGIARLRYPEPKVVWKMCFADRWELRIHSKGVSRSSSRSRLSGSPTCWFSLRERPLKFFFTPAVDFPQRGAELQALQARIRSAESFRPHREGRNIGIRH